MKQKESPLGLSFSALDKLLDLRALADSVAQIEELGASDLTASDDLNVFNSGRVNGEGLFNTATVCDVTNCEGLGNTAAVLGNNSTLENLNSLSCTLFDFVVNLNGITYVKFGHLSFKLFARKSSEFIHSKTPPVIPDIRAERCRGLSLMCTLHTLTLYHIRSRKAIAFEKNV